MAIKSSITAASKSAKSLFLTFTLLLSLSFFIVFFFFSSPASNPTNSFPQTHFLSFQNSIKVYVPNLPRSLNYGLLQQYWDSDHPDSRIPSDPDHRISTTHISKPAKYPPYPENPLIKQYSAEYWIMGDLETPQEMRAGSFAKRVFDANEADVVFVPFFAILSAEMELGSGSGAFRKKAGNRDYLRQKKVVDFVRNTDAWKRSGGRDHVFVLTDPVAMWHFREEIAPAILLVVDFGGWYRLDTQSSDGTSSDMIRHTQVSLLKDVIVPYTHLLPRFQLSENQK